MIIRSLGLVIVLGCLAVIYIFESSNSLTGFFRIFHWPAIILTGIGPLGLVLMSSERKSLLLALKMTFQSQTKQKKNTNFNLDKMSELGERYYSEGPSVLEGIDENKYGKVLAKVFDRISMRIPLKDIMGMMEIERNKTQASLSETQNVFNLGSKYAPSIGMLGTILGMVQLLSHVSDPSKLGPAMSLALMTTFYGLFFSLVVWNPLSQRVTQIADGIMDYHDQSIHWLKTLEERKPGHYFDQTKKADSQRLHS